MSKHKPLTKGELTAENIRKAIVRIQNGRVKKDGKIRSLSITSVAEEAGISRAHITNNHPVLAERIHVAGDKGIRKQRDEKQVALKKLRKKNADLRKELAIARKLNQNMASENASMAAEMGRLRAIAESKKVVSFPLIKD